MPPFISFSESVPDKIALSHCTPHLQYSSSMPFLQTRGGGNCANALTAAARLGLDSFLVSKIGDDGIGEQIEQELLDDGVHLDFLLKAQEHPSPFTYIVVDKTGMLG